MQISKPSPGSYSSLNFISLTISAVTLSLLLAGFLRIEMKLNYQEAKLAAVERLCTGRAPDISREGSTAVKVKSDTRPETTIRTRRHAVNNSNQQTNELIKIRNEIKNNLKKMKEENSRVCRSPLGSILKEVLHSDEIFKRISANYVTDGQLSKLKLLYQV